MAAFSLRGLGLAVVLLSLDPVTADSEMIVETPPATISHDPDDQDVAGTVAEALELAGRALGPRWGDAGPRLRVYVHHSTETMVDGLMTTLAYDRAKAELLAMIGISPSSKHVLHVHAKTRRWGQSLWHAVVHEYAHGLVEERYGMTPALSARWLYEGLGDHEAHQAVRARFPEFEERWRRSRLRVAREAESSGTWLPLARLATEDEWSTSIRKGRVTWDLQYAQAYAAVAYLVEQYGLDGLKTLLARLATGASLDDAMGDVLGTPLVHFEAGVRRFVIRASGR